MAVNIAPDARLAFFDSDGNPLVGGKLYTYAAGSTTPQSTFTDSTGTTANPNPIVLNAGGRTPNGVWLSEGSSYKFVLEDAAGVEIWSEDNIAGVNDTGQTQSQWAGSGSTPTFVSGTQFTVSGDRTDVFQVGRRIKATVTAGTAYGTITGSAYTTLTTVDVLFDAGDSLDAGLSVVELGLITPVNTSLPNLYFKTRTITGTATITRADLGKPIRLTGAAPYTVTFDAAADLGDDFILPYIYNDSDGVVTLEPDGAETIDGAANYAIAKGESFALNCNGTALFTDRPETIKLDGGTVNAVKKEGASPSSVASVEITGLELGYDYEIVFTGCQPATNSVKLRLRVSTDNGSTWVSSAGTYNTQNLQTASTALSANGGDADAHYMVVGNQSNDPGAKMAGFIRIFDPMSTSVLTHITSDIEYVNTSGNRHFDIVRGVVKGPEASHNALQITYSSGNIAAIDYTVRKIKR